MDKIGPRIEKIRAAITDDVAAGFTTSESSPFTPLSRAFRAGASLLGIGLGLSALFSYYYDYKSPNYIEALLIAALRAVAALLLCKAIDRQGFIICRLGQICGDACCHDICTSCYIHSIQGCKEYRKALCGHTDDNRIGASRNSS